jgi:aryl-alcohol dehydrogenase-like predicted oxidoreductase
MQYRRLGQSGLNVSELSLGRWPTFGVTRAELALAWAQRQPAISSVITGATKPGQLESNLKAVSITLSSDVLTAIDAVFPPTAES